MLNKIGITGSSGSLGKVILKNKKNFRIIKFNGDLRNRKKVFNWITKNKIKTVIHLAAVVPIRVVNLDKKKAYNVNLIGTKNIVDASIKNRINWFFFSSTSHVYKSSNKKISENFLKKPISFYGKTKLLAENYIIKNFKKNKLNYCIGRIFSTTNKNQKKNYLIPDLKYKIKKSNKVIKLENLHHYRDFISMNDISQIIFKLYSQKFCGVLNLGSGKKVYLKDIAKIIAKKYHKKIIFKDNKKLTSLIADNKKLKKIIKFKLASKIEKMIF